MVRPTQHLNASKSALGLSKVEIKLSGHNKGTQVNRVLDLDVIPIYITELRREVRCPGDSMTPKLRIFNSPQPLHGAPARQ